mmetsp:Transcript_9057/g.16336  ORF Transcript_9057/g.16336 Transcript_9057/m.16336 type:complete len:128 (-) Transcript_9057:234-617(-)|eukprot:CAMPEP_0177774938 /NCGR_PEP_ID=MMETSP0491_2-20121128/13806_1 /TAXON_ID=63592 /ORGANISM="Tetraselmis chuii, Strain PLY429" /LENGTH=127 /DNA_ID=CAMNT_0019293415 /DNA_START=245 /DNA_END=628 /DNA_ORIENTATION=-
MDNIQPAYEALLSSVAEVVAIKSLYNPGATLEAEEAKVQQCWIAFNNACDSASLQLEGAKAHLLREQAGTIREHSGQGQGNDAQTAAALESKTLGLYQELQKSASIPTDVGGIKAETAEGAIKTEGG